MTDEKKVGSRGNGDPIQESGPAHVDEAGVVPQETDRLPTDSQPKPVAGLERRQIIEAMLAALPQSYGKPPNAVVIQATMARLKMSSSHRNVLAFMVDKLGPENRSLWWAKKKMAEQVGVSEKTVLRTVQHAESRGWLFIGSRHIQGSRYVNEYFFREAFLDAIREPPHERPSSRAGTQAGPSSVTRDILSGGACHPVTSTRGKMSRKAVKRKVGREALGGSAAHSPTNPPSGRNPTDEPIDQQETPPTSTPTATVAERPRDNRRASKDESGEERYSRTGSDQGWSGSRHVVAYEQPFACQPDDLAYVVPYEVRVPERLRGWTIASISKTLFDLVRPVFKGESRNRFLTFYSDRKGTGKTVSGVALLQFFVDTFGQRSERSWPLRFDHHHFPAECFVDWGDLCDQLADYRHTVTEMGWGITSEIKVCDWCRRGYMECSALLIDDFLLTVASPKILRGAAEILHHRYSRNQLTILTTNRSRAETTAAFNSAGVDGEAIVSRMAPAVVTFDGSDQRDWDEKVPPVFHPSEEHARELAGQDEKAMRTYLKHGVDGFRRPFHTRMELEQLPDQADWVDTTKVGDVTGLDDAQAAKFLPVALLIQTRGHHARHEWADAAEKAGKLLDMGLEGQDRDEVQLIRLNALYYSGGSSLQRAREELRDYMGRQDKGISRPLHALKGYLRLAAGDYEAARAAFLDCKESLGTQDNELHRKILGYPHSREPRLGEVAALMALGREKEARDRLGAALKEYVTAEDQSFLDRARDLVAGGPLQRRLAPLGDLTSIQLTDPWVTWHWKWDDMGFTNGSAFALTNVKVSVWSEKADGGRYKDETKIADIKELAPGQGSGKQTCEGLVNRAEVKRVMLRIQSDQGERTIIAKEY